jgi:prevent-host-death family protein
MNIDEDIKSVTYLKTHAAEILKRLNQNRRPVIVTQNGEPRAVIQDSKSYEEMKRALGILKILAPGERDVARGAVEEQSRVFVRLQRKLKKR